MLVGGVVMSFILNPKLATVIFAVIPIIGVIAALVIRFVIPIFRKRQKLVDSVNRFIREKLSGIRVIRAFNRTEKEDARFDERNEALSDLTLKFQRMMSVLIPICIVLIIIALDCLILIAANNFNTMDPVTEADKLMSAIGDLQAFVIYMIMIVSAVTMTAAMFVIVPRAKISAARITEVLDIIPSVKDPEEAEKIDENSRGTVEFKNVSFGYNEAESYVLSDISFTAEKGRVTAFIGSTGSGKSTIANLIMRFYDVNEGQILFGGKDIRSLNQDEFHKNIAFVPQKAMLFSGSVRENLLYGDEEADDAQLRFARTAPIFQAVRSRDSASRELSHEMPMYISSTTASQLSTSRPMQSCARQSRIISMQLCLSLLSVWVPLWMRIRLLFLMKARLSVWVNIMSLWKAVKFTVKFTILR